MLFILEFITLSIPVVRLLTLSLATECKRIILDRSLNGFWLVEFVPDDELRFKHFGEMYDVINIANIIC